MEKNSNYLQNIQQALRFIDSHYQEEIDIKQVAAQANYSTFHFHRMFKSIVKESVYEFIRRKRIEKAGALLYGEQSKSIKEVYLRSGFSSNSSFTKAFKKFYQLSPVEFQKKAKNELGFVKRMKSKNGQIETIITQYIWRKDKLMNWLAQNAKDIKTQEVPLYKLAYMMHVGPPMKLAETFQKLIGWAAPKGLLANSETKVMTIFHDSIKVTDPEKTRMSACVSITNKDLLDEDLSFRELDAGKCVVGSFEIEMQEFEYAWTGLYAWCNEQGCKFRDHSPFEIYHNNWQEHPEKKSIVDLYIPVE